MDNINKYTSAIFAIILSMSCTSCAKYMATTTKCNPDLTPYQCFNENIKHMGESGFIKKNMAPSEKMIIPEVDLTENTKESVKS